MLKTLLTNLEVSLIMFIMIIPTVFIIFDMPLTNKISNFLNKYDNKRKQRNNEEIDKTEIVIKPASDNIRSKFDSLSKGGCA